MLTQQEFDRIESDFKQVKREMKRKLRKAFVEEKLPFHQNSLRKKPINSSLNSAKNCMSWRSKTSS
ncbi:hypothetical protein SynA1544_02631 [Synechococcus sp. A15-44]|nr:hypothetical protein SynA1544_02631 [Synechococcus sp. A15-44]